MLLASLQGRLVEVIRLTRKVNKRVKKRKLLLMKRVVIVQKTIGILAEDSREEVDVQVIELRNMKRHLIPGGRLLKISMSKSSMMEEKVSEVRHAVTEETVPAMIMDIIDFKRAMEMEMPVVRMDTIDFKRHKENELELYRENLRSNFKRRKKNLKI